MATADLMGVLRTAKAALDEELISKEDFESIKVAWVTAQRIKAGLEAGFIREEDCALAHSSFLHALDFKVDHPGAPALQVASQPLTCTAPPYPQPRPPGGGPLTHGPGGGPLTAAHAAGGLGGARSANGSAQPRATPTAPPPPPPPPPPAAAAAFMMAAAAGGGGIAPRGSGGPPPASAVPQSTSGELPGTIPIPTDLHRVGRAGVAEGKKSMSGIGVQDSCINLFNHIKTRSSYKWVSYKIDDAGTEVVVDQLGAPDSTYEQFLATLPAQQCRYAVFDWAFSNQDTGQIQQKLVFIHWAPISSSTKAKMMYASTKEFLKGYLEGVGAELQADTVEELQENELVARIALSMARK